MASPEVKEVLRKAADILAAGGWTKGAFYIGPRGRREFCLFGAIYEAGGWDPLAETNETMPPVVRQADDHICRYLGRKLGVKDTYVGWNAAQETKWPVLRALLAAADWDAPS